MAKKVYIGVGGVSRKIKKLYIGIGGVARKVKKGYIGVGGVARLFYQAGWSGINWHGDIDPLPFYPRQCAAGHVGNYCMIGGGYRLKMSSKSNSSLYSGDDPVYNTDLVQTTVSKVSDASEGVGCCTFRNNQYLVYAGGSKLGTTQSIAYNTELYRTKPSGLSTNSDNGQTVASVGNYIIFTGRYRNITTDVFNSDLVISQISGPSDSIYSCFGGLGGETSNYALFAGGEGSDNVTVTVYNENLVKSTAPNLSANDYNTLNNGATVGKGTHVLFCVGNSEPYTTVDCYTNNLTKVTVASLNTPSGSDTEGPITINSLDDFGVFFFEGTNGGEYYTADLVKVPFATSTTLGSNVSVNVGYIDRCRSVSIGNYLLVMGGNTGGTSRMNNVRAFTLV